MSLAFRARPDGATLSPLSILARFLWHSAPIMLIGDPTGRRAFLAGWAIDHSVCCSISEEKGSRLEINNHSLDVFARRSWISRGLDAR